MTNCIIRPINTNNNNDIYNIWKLRNDKNTYLYLHNVTMYSFNETKQWLNNLLSTSQRLIVEELGFIGLIRIDNIDNINQNCMVGLDIAIDCRGKGLSYTIYRKLLNYLFLQMNMNMIYLEVLESNKRAIHIYNKLGFTQQGQRRQAIFRNGKYENSIMMDLLREEYNE
jgi:RimJ/RimL family protein N-acetyltransferase